MNYLVKSFHCSIAIATVFSGCKSRGSHESQVESAKSTSTERPMFLCTGYNKNPLNGDGAVHQYEVTGFKAPNGYKADTRVNIVVRYNRVENGVIPKWEKILETSGIIKSWSSGTNSNMITFDKNSGSLKLDLKNDGTTRNYVGTLKLTKDNKTVQVTCEPEDRQDEP